MSTKETSFATPFVCILVVLASIALPVGCARRESPPEPYYDLTFVNSTDQLVTEVVVTFGGYELDLGHIGGGVTKSEVGCMEPVSRSITLRWRAPGGESQQWNATIGETLPEDFEGEISLTLHPNSEVVIAVTHGRR